MSDHDELRETIEALARAAGDLAEHAVNFGSEHSRKSASDMLDATETILEGIKRAAATHSYITLGGLTVQAPTQDRIRSLVAGDEMEAIAERRDRLRRIAGLLAAKVEVGSAQRHLEDEMARIDQLQSRFERGQATEEPDDVDDGEPPAEDG